MTTSNTNMMESNKTIVLHNLIVGGFDFGLMDYEVPDMDYRIRLNNKLLEHYRFYEIGQETPEMFKHYLNTSLNEIMPYYNQLIESQLIAINPLLSFERVLVNNKKVNNDTVNNVNGVQEKKGVNDTKQDIKNNTSLDNSTNSSTDETQLKDSNVEQDSTTNSDKSRNSSTVKDSQNVFSDTPQSLLSSANIINEKYATNATIDDETNTLNEGETIDSSEGIVKDETATTKIDSETNNTSNTDSESVTDNSTIVNDDVTTTNDIVNDTSQEMVEVTNITENGFTVSLSELLIRYRDTFINPDEEIIEHKKIRECFMLVY